MSWSLQQASGLKEPQKPNKQSQMCLTFPGTPLHLSAQNSTTTPLSRTWQQKPNACVSSWANPRERTLAFSKCSDTILKYPAEIFWEARPPRVKTYSMSRSQYNTQSSLAPLSWTPCLWAATCLTSHPSPGPALTCVTETTSVRAQWALVRFVSKWGLVLVKPNLPWGHVHTLRGEYTPMSQQKSRSGRLKFTQKLIFKPPSWTSVSDPQGGNSVFISNRIKHKTGSFLVLKWKILRNHQFCPWNGFFLSSLRVS